MNLRRAFAGTGIVVTELIPPAVATGVAGPGQEHGADVDEVCDAVFGQLADRREEVGFGPTAAPGFRQRLAEERGRFHTRG
ncbi:hypothetical protein [Lentzea sp. NPDC059081]|uniref:hypothetical protein n=1 Tax=Lentzea sp. NPDC059081 TaxID=3346719 RepID=UPI0036872C52